MQPAALRETVYFQTLRGDIYLILPFELGEMVVFSCPRSCLYQTVVDMPPCKVLEHGLSSASSPPPTRSARGVGELSSPPPQKFFSFSAKPGECSERWLPNCSVLVVLESVSD